MKLLYLTFFEAVHDNGVYESQVKRLLCKLAHCAEQGVQIAHLAFLAAVLVGRDGVTLPFLRERPVLSAVKLAYEKGGVKASFFFVPIAILKRWNAQQGLPLALILFAVTVPVVVLKVLFGRYDVIHCRSYPAAVLGLMTRLFCRNVKVIFDPRGFYPEEGILHGRWTDGSISFRTWRWIERHLFRRSDLVVGLSDVFVNEIKSVTPDAKCELIYASTDVSRCAPAHTRRSLVSDTSRGEGDTFVYCGNLGSWHDPALLAEVFGVIYRELPQSRLLVITPSKREELTEIFTAKGLHAGCFEIVSAKPNEVPTLLARADFGMVPLRGMAGSNAMRRVADTMIGLKVAEYLACGLPLILNTNIQGLQSLMASRRIGTTFDPGHLENLPQAIREMRANYAQYRADCLAVASEYFSLDGAALAYLRLYRSLTLQLAKAKGAA